MPSILTTPLLIVLASGAVHQGPAHMLQRKLVKGDTDRYTMSMITNQNMDMAGMGAQNVKTDMEADYVFKVGKVMPGGQSANIDAIVHTKKFDMGGMMGMGA